MSYYETHCSHEANDIQFKYGQITQRIVTCATGMYESLSKISLEIYMFNFEYLLSGQCIFM